MIPMKNGEMRVFVGEGKLWSVAKDRNRFHLNQENYREEFGFSDQFEGGTLAYKIDQPDNSLRPFKEIKRKALDKLGVFDFKLVYVGRWRCAGRFATAYEAC